MRRFVPLLLAGLVWPRPSSALTVEIPAFQGTFVSAETYPVDEASQSFGDEPEILVETQCGAGGCFPYRIAMLQWDLAEIPASAEIEDVSLVLALTEPPDPHHGVDLVLHRPWSDPPRPVGNSVAWDEHSVTARGSEWFALEIPPTVYLANPGPMVPGADEDSTRPGPDGLVIFELTDAATSGELVGLVERWLADPASNYGLSLSIVPFGEPGNSFRFASDESANPPLLVIDFVPEPSAEALLAAAVAALAVAAPNPGSRKAKG